MPPLRFARVETSIGSMWVAETDRGVAGTSRSERLEAFLEPLRRRLPGYDAVPADLDAGWVDAGTLPPVDLRGLSGFDAEVYRVVRSIPAGQTMTYGEVAAAVGSPLAARAVGNAMGRCPLFPAVPCHRVVRASDGWSGWGGDPRLKRRLLVAEREQRAAASTASPAADRGRRVR